MSSQSPIDDQTRFSPIGEDDHAGYLWIVTTLGIIYVGLAAALRGHIKWGLIGSDDYCLAIATMVHFGQAAAVFYGLNNGLSKFNSITTETQWLMSGKSFIAAEVLAIIALCLGKCSIILLSFRVFANDRIRNWIACVLLVFLSVAWAVGSVVALGVNCNAGTILTELNTIQCPNQYLRWQAIAAIDIIIDTLIFILPVVMVWHLNMPFKLKFQVVLAFSFRLPLIVASAVHLADFKDYPSSPEPQFAVTNALISQQAMITWSLISATIPNMKTFMKSFSTGLSFPEGWGSLYNTSDISYPLRSIKASSSAKRSFRGGDLLSSRERNNPPSAASNRSLVLRPEPGEHNTTISHVDNRGAMTEEEYSLERRRSEEMRIKREVHWNVYHESR